MLAIEQQKLNNILNDMLLLGQDALDINQKVLAILETEDLNAFSGIEKISKKSRAESIAKIDTQIINVFALYTPEARDLRQLVAFLKITNEFDRIMNSSYSFIRDFPHALSDEVDKKFILEYTIPLQKTCVNAISYALKLLSVEDKREVDEFYKIVVLEEDKNDALYKIIEKSLLNKIHDDIHLFKEYQGILSALRRLEKIADRAMCIASLMHFAIIGGEINRVKTR